MKKILVSGVAAVLLTACSHQVPPASTASSTAEPVLASSFGWNAADATKCLQPSLIDMNAATPAKGICFINVDVPQGVRVKNADASFCGGTFKSVE